MLPTVCASASFSTTNSIPHESNDNSKTNNKNKSDDKVTTGYAFADNAIPHSTRNRERKRVVPWTEEEHILFLFGLQKVGKGDWRGISRNFVKRRTPTQVASHAQKHFLRRSNLNRRRRSGKSNGRRASLSTREHNSATEANGFVMMPTAFPMTVTPVVQPVPTENTIENLTLAQGNQSNNNVATAKIIRPVPIFPVPQASDLNLN
ncbi:hypothetical protein DITRI_Ditri04bG0061200 [Diplodiscus trichospermus]